MRFFEINPENQILITSLLSKFRVHRLQEITKDEMLLEKGIRSEKRGNNNIFQRKS